MKTKVHLGAVVLALLMLVGCGGTGAPPAPTPPTTINVFDFMFRSKGVDIGPAKVYDNVTGDVAVRVTYTDTATSETHSVYEISRPRGCILVVAEEIWNRPPRLKLNAQTYWDDEESLKKVCYFPLTVTDGVPVRTDVKLAYWDWTDGIGKAQGTWSAWTIVTYAKGRLTIEEWYNDQQHPPTYHRVLVFGPEGILSLKDVR